MDKEIIFIVEESLDGGYEARALGYSIFTEAETLEELRLAIKDAVKCHFPKGKVPPIIRMHIVKDELIPV
uniref:2-oxoisovalerate dehydrogenase n=1 Tax=candidate division WOR-3 bacterium TaxID=2052148 RepID=A0A7V0Z7R1_UNCW3